MASGKNSKRHLTSHYSSVHLFDKNAVSHLKALEVAHCNPLTIERDETVKDEPLNNQVDQESMTVPTVSESMFCHSCQVDFADREDQLQHYKCDWHRYNLHLRLRGLPGVSEEEFEKVAGDVSSISGSDDESESESNNLKMEVGASFGADLADKETESLPNERKFHKVFFKNEKGELISLHRCLLHHKKKPLTHSSELCNAARLVACKPKWIILMVSAGHFAGAVFNGEEILEHKTFHRYTVRAKRGTAQSSRDGQGNAPKSAGSSLRRYNEAALVQDVQELMSSWLNHLNSRDLVFVHIPVANRAMFYAGKNPVLKKDDDRVRIIPFPTRRPTFSEVKRVHQMLASIECYGQEADVRDFIPLSPKRMYNKESGKLELCPQQSPKPAKKLTKESLGAEDKKPDVADAQPAQVNSTEEESPNEDLDLVEMMESVSFAADLKEFDSSVNKKKKKKKGKKPQDSCESSSNENKQFIDEGERKIRNDIFTACKVGNIEGLHKAIEEIEHLPSHADNALDLPSESQSLPSSENENRSKDNGSQSDQTQVSKDDSIKNIDKPNELPTETQGNGASDHQSEEVESPLSKIINTPIDDNGNTYLHLASSSEHSEVVSILLDKGGNPVIKNQGGKLPYNLGNGDVRNAFRRFMAQHPDKYDYLKAQIPAPLTAEMEEQKRQKLAKKRAEKKKVANEKNKAKKAVEKQVKAEEEEKSRFLNLSDREKRALAAEKRILQQHAGQGSTTPVLSRCWKCATDITGKIPFEYADFKFCTTKCLKDHRAKAKS